MDDREGESGSPMKYKPHIPNFTLVGQCGQGGSSTVWLAVDRDGIRRAIRILDRQVPENRSRIETETQAIARYRKRVSRHRNLLEILYFGRTEKHLYYVTEPADNSASGRRDYQPDTLAGRIRRGNYSRSEMLSWIESLLDGVEDLHNCRLAHRDLKPENILFLHGRLTIGDPGLCAPIPDPDRGGTPGFHPPWPCQDGKEIDIYSIGKIIYCLYSRKDAASFPEVPPEIPLRQIAGLNRIALKCCEKQPERRFRCAAEIRREIRMLRTLPAWKRGLAVLMPALLSGRTF